MTENKGWTVIEVSKSAWAMTRLQEPWAITLAPRQWGMRWEIATHTLGQVIDLAVAADLGASPARDIPGQVGVWMFTLGLAPISAIGKATKSLSRDQNLDILGGWFNGGNGLPSPSDQPGSARENAKIRLNLGHPSILNQFLRWLIRYLGTHESVDGRIDQGCGEIISLCRRLQGKPNVRRF